MSQKHHHDDDEDDDHDERPHESFASIRLIRNLLEMPGECPLDCQTSIIDATECLRQELTQDLCKVNVAIRVTVRLHTLHDPDPLAFVHQVARIPLDAVCPAVMRRGLSAKELTVDRVDETVDFLFLRRYIAPLHALDPHSGKLSPAKIGHSLYQSVDHHELHSHACICQRAMSVPVSFHHVCRRSSACRPSRTASRCASNGACVSSQ